MRGLRNLSAERSRRRRQINVLFSINAYTGRVLGSLDVRSCHLRVWKPTFTRWDRGARCIRRGVSGMHSHRGQNLHNLADARNFVNIFLLYYVI